MKTYIYFFLFFATLTAKAQDKSVYEHVISNVTKGFNSADYSSVYNLLSPEFKTNINQKDFTAFLGRTAALGKITSTEYTGDSEGFRVYKTTFEKGILSMLIACNEKSQIDGFALRPFKAKVKRPIPVANDNKKDTELDQEVDKAVTGLMSDPDIAGTVVAVIKGAEVYYYHYGDIDKKSPKLPDNKTIFEIGSISKTFTGILLAQAVLDGKIKLDDDIRKYLPAKCSGLQLEGKPILVKQLSNHTSGLPRLPDDLGSTPGYNEKDPYKHYSKEMYYNYLARVKLASVPGKIQEYSNTGVAVLGIILEKIYGQTYTQLLKKHITDPLKMSNTYIEIPEKQLTNFATGYNNGAEAPHWNLASSSPAGGIRSTLNDMVVYLTANMREVLPAIALSHKETFKEGNEITGLNWFMPTTKNGDTLVWHNGGTGGFTSYIGYLKDKRVGIVVLTNSASENGPDKVGSAILKFLQ